ncbi:hypothetical protein SprV_0200555900 [Sparganum proliferum]
MRRRASGGASSGDAATAASTTIREEDGTAGDRTRLNQVSPTDLRLPLLRPLHELSLHEHINRLTDLDFFPASGSISTVRFVDDASVPDNRVVLKTLPASEQTRSRAASPLSLNIPHALPTRAYGVPGGVTRRLTLPPSLNTPRPILTRQHRASEQTRSRTASPLSLNIPHALPTRAYGEGVEVSVHVHGESVYACKQARLTQF